MLMIIDDYSMRIYEESYINGLIHMMRATGQMFECQHFTVLYNMMTTGILKIVLSVSAEVCLSISSRMINYPFYQTLK